MKFSEAIESLMDGKILKDKTFKKEFIVRYNKQRKIFQIKHKFSPIWSLFDVDVNILCSDTWEIVEENEPELHTFEEAIKALKEGKVIRRENYKYKLKDGCILRLEELPVRVVSVEQLFYGAPNDDQWLDYKSFSTQDILADDWIIED